MSIEPPAFAVPAELDKVTVAIERQRDIPGEPWDIVVSGHSRKRVHVLWTYSERIEDKRNVESTVAWILSSVTYYLPTSPEKFLRACVGGETSGPGEEHPQLPL